MAKSKENTYKQDDLTKAARKVKVSPQLFDNPDFIAALQTALLEEKDKYKALQWAKLFYQERPRVFISYLKNFDDPKVAYNFYREFGATTGERIRWLSEWSKLGLTPQEVKVLMRFFKPSDLERETNLKNLIKIIDVARKSGFSLRPTPQQKQSLIYLARNLKKPELLVAWRMVSRNINDIVRYIKVFGEDGYERAYSVKEMGHENTLFFKTK
jgi:hypothetical protein